MGHKHNLDAQNIAATAAALTVQSGLPVDDAVKVGGDVASQVAKSYSESIKQNRSGNKTGGGGTGSGGAGAQQPILTASNPSPPSSQWRYVGGNKKNKKRLSQTVPYQKGTATAMQGVSIARPKSEIVENKALVVSGMPTDINGARMKKYIDAKAARAVELLKVVRLDREHAGWAAVVIELNDNDYNLLSNPDFWEEDVYIRAWTGPRFWRRKFIKPHERKNLLRRQWDP